MPADGRRRQGTQKPSVDLYFLVIPITAFFLAAVFI
jgi:hypothetical protein